MNPPMRNAARAKDAANIADPAAVQAKFMKGFALHQSGQLARAQAFYQQVLKMQPEHFDALHLLGVIAFQTRNPAQAVELIGRAIEIDPGNAVAYNNRGTALQDLRQLDEALDSFGHALNIKPDYAEALNNRGNTLLELGRFNEALESFDGALKLKPDYAQAWSNRGNLLLDLRRLDEALENIDRALKLNPDYVEALNNRGYALQELKRPVEALDCYDRALKLKPDHIAALCGRGDILQELNQPSEALVSYDRALRIEPNIPYLYGTWLQAKMKIGDWSDAENRLSRLLQKIQRGEKTIRPFTLLAFTESLQLQRKAAEILVKDRYPSRLALPAIAKYAGHEKIRVGYYSADFHNHATMYLMAELFERHDRVKFEWVGFSFGPDVNDEMRKRVSAAFDRFIDVRSQSDKDIALLSRNLEIDIAVDLKGLTHDMRVGIFSYRAAPVQVDYLGYPGTMGAEYIDYLIADGTLVPQASQQYYSEKIAYLPDSYQVNDRKRVIADRTFTRSELGLPDVGFVFCCFNDSYKITPRTFSGWMRILKEVPGSVLWLLEGDRGAAEHLRKIAEQSGVTAGRLIFARRLPLAEHLARHRSADLFLDTLPCNAHTTASDALWAGLPLLTCTGEAFASRVAASLLNAIGVPELITTTQQQYEALAVELATDAERLGQIRRTLERNRLTTPLFDTELFARHIESAYLQMYERYQADLPPEHIHVGL
jgi:predicted O-linked N-acetylglucosamine transferase (SPINDLY family)